ncbi:hypothetical protein [Nocardia sp. SC052]|uniref:hypothetical protein n=1 Tax=Nocardia sichangensis TaxID=3385975 RepID=UPI0039A37FA7
MPSYGSINQDGAKDAEGKLCSDGSPRNPLVDRWIQNLRRCVGYDVDPEVHGGSRVRRFVPRKDVTVEEVCQDWLAACIGLGARRRRDTGTTSRPCENGTAGSRYRSSRKHLDDLVSALEQDGTKTEKGKVRRPWAARW